MTVLRLRLAIYISSKPWAAQAGTALGPASAVLPPLTPRILVLLSSKPIQCMLQWLDCSLGLLQYHLSLEDYESFLTKFIVDP